MVSKTTALKQRGRLPDGFADTEGIPMLGAIFEAVAGLVGAVIEGTLEWGFGSAWEGLGTGYCVMLIGAGMAIVGILLLLAHDVSRMLSAALIGIGIPLAALGWSFRRQG